MMARAAKLAALILAVAMPMAPHEASFAVQAAGAKAGECLGLKPDTAKRLSGALKTDPRLPNSEIAFWNYLNVVQSTATSCGIVQGVSAVSVQQNTALTAAIGVTNSVTGQNATCLLVYLGLTANGEHMFLFVLVPEDAEQATAPAPL